MFEYMKHLDLVKEMIAGIEGFEHTDMHFDSVCCRDLGIMFPRFDSHDIEVHALLHGAKCQSTSTSNIEYPISSFQLRRRRHRRRRRDDARRVAAQTVVFSFFVVVRLAVAERGRVGPRRRLRRRLRRRVHRSGGCFGPSGAVQAIRGVSPAGLVFGPPVRSRKTLGRSGAFQAMRPVPVVSRASTARWEGPTGASDGPTAWWRPLANFSELPCSILAYKAGGF